MRERERERDRKEVGATSQHTYVVRIIDRKWRPGIESAVSADFRRLEEDYFIHSFLRRI